MTNLSLKDFNNLTEEEKGERYKELSDHDKFLVRISTIPSGKTIGYIKLTEQEKKEAKEFENAVKDGKIDEWFKKETTTKFDIET